MAKASLRGIVFSCAVGAAFGWLVTLATTWPSPEPTWMWLVRACERDKDRCSEAEAHLARQCNAGDRAACAYPPLTKQ
jgi:hypothetical protein